MQMSGNNSHLSYLYYTTNSSIEAEICECICLAWKEEKILKRTPFGRKPWYNTHGCQFNSLSPSTPPPPTLCLYNFKSQRVFGWADPVFAMLLAGHNSFELRHAWAVPVFAVFCAGPRLGLSWAPMGPSVFTGFLAGPRRAC